MSRVLRFQRVLREVARARRIDFAALAQRHGYSDQAHLIRDFSSLIGVPPSRFLSYSEQLYDPSLPIWTGLHPGEYAASPSAVVSWRRADARSTAPLRDVDA
jgi:AraC-like DNA-binding protein